MLQKQTIESVLLMLAIAGFSTARAADVSIRILFPATLESIDMRFEEGSKHFVTMLRREGTAEGSGSLAGATVNEYGWHDVDPPNGARAYGYLQFKTADGDIANIEWTLRAVFVKGEDKPIPVNSGVWELISGTGRFEDLTGVGTLSLEFVSKSERLYTLEGELGARSW